jgi:hypothetical protein
MNIFSQFNLGFVVREGGETGFVRLTEARKSRSFLHERYSIDELDDWLRASRHGVCLHLSLLAYVYSN